MLVTFRQIGVDGTEVTLDLNFQPEGLAEQAGDKLGVVKTTAKGDLRRFKEFIESLAVSWPRPADGRARSGTARPPPDSSPGFEVASRWSWIGMMAGDRGSSSHSVTMLAATGTVSHHAHSFPKTRRGTHHSPAANATRKQAKTCPTVSRIPQRRRAVRSPRSATR